MNKWLIRLAMAAAIFAAAWARPGHADTISCLDDKGAVLFAVPDASILTYWRCLTPLLNGTRKAGTLRKDWTEAGTPRRSDVKLYTATGTGVWSWVAPTVGLPNLDHYLMFRQAGAAPATIFAQIDGRTEKLILPMGAAEFGACFWFQSVGKDGVVNPQRSNAICLGTDGRPVPGV